MNETSDTQRPWLDRLSDALLREPQDRKQLIGLLRDAKNRDLMDSEALAMIEGVLQVSEMQVRDIMIPRSQMVVVEIDDKPETFLPHIIESAHSRFPVIGESRDEIVGLLLAKDLLQYAFNKKINFNIKDNLRPAQFVPESIHLDALLREFRQTRNHMAIVADEYGGVAGLVTIEDVLEQIVGEIEDETDVEEGPYIHPIDEIHFTVKALTSIEDFNEYFNTNFNDDEFDTIGGLITHQFGHVPNRDETVQFKQFNFKILHADNRRVHLFSVTKHDEA